MISHVLLKNGCQHDRLALDIVPGLTAIVGPNGCGKSNLGRCIAYALTGEIPGGGTRSTLLKWGADSGSVDLTLQTQAGPLTIHRDLAEGKHSIKNAKGETLARTKATVNAIISKQLGMDVSVVAKLAFVAQGNIPGLLEMDHSDRSKLFYELFGASSALKKRDALLQIVNKIVNYPNRSKELQDVVLLQAEHTKNYSKLAGDSAQLTGQLDVLKGQEAMLNQTVALPTAEELLPAIEMANSYVLNAIYDQESAKETMGKLDLFKCQPPDPEGARKAYMKDQCQKAQTTLADSQRDLLAHEPPAKPAEGRIDMSAFNDLKVELREALNKMNLMDKGKCPTCGQVTTVTDKERKTIQDRYDFTNKLIEGHQARAYIINPQWDQYEQELKTYERLKSGYESNMRNAKASVDQNISAVDFDTKTYQSECQKWNEWRSYEAAYNTAKSSLAAATSMLPVREKELAALKASPTVTAEMKKLATDTIKIIAELKSQDRALAISLGEVKTKLQLCDERRQRLEAEETVRMANETAYKVLSRSRELLNVDMLPRLTLGSAVPEINGMIDAYLRQFNAPYQLFLNSELDFEVSFGTNVADVSALSGGQKVVAGMVVRFALLEILAKEIGILILDEPTAFLDEPNMKSLVEVLKMMAGYASQRGIVMLVPTHEDLLRTAATSTVDIGV